MKKLFIENISPGDEVVDFFLVRSKKVGSTRTGKPYLDLELQDRTGIATAKVWDDAEKYDPKFKRGDVIKIKAYAESYRDQTQIKISQIRLATENEAIDLADFVPATDKDIPAMLEEVKGFIAGIENRHLAALLGSFFGDEQFVDGFKNGIGARNIHHAYRGGLLEHTLQVVKLADSCAALYPDLDRDILIAMSILHDIGKIRELASSNEFIYTTEGYLIGHIPLGLQMLDERIRGIEGFPEELALRAKHILISHHGELEFGSPVVPKTPEAIVLHYIDNLDAKTNLILRAIAKDKNETEEFTEYNRVMERNFYKGQPRGGNEKEG